MEKKLGPYFKQKGLKLKKKKKALLKKFWSLIKKHFGPYLLGALGDGLSGLAIGSALNKHTTLWEDDVTSSSEEDVFVFYVAEEQSLNEPCRYKRTK